MRPDDQPRPDLDAAIDAVVPALTEVSDGAAADSLRRTRMALSDVVPARSAFGWPWRVAGPVAAAAVVTMLALWPHSRPADDDRVGRIAPRPAATRPLPTTAAVAATSAPPAPRVRPTRLGRTAAAPAASEPAVAAGPRRDPLDDLIAAVQQIPEDAWTASRARVEAPVAVAEVPLAPITVTALDTPSISTLPADPIAPGEP